MDVSLSHRTDAPPPSSPKSCQVSACSLSEGIEAVIEQHRPWQIHSSIYPHLPSPYVPASWPQLYASGCPDQQQRQQRQQLQQHRKCSRPYANRHPFRRQGGCLAPPPPSSPPAILTKASRATFMVCPSPYPNQALRTPRFRPTPTARARSTNNQTAVCTALHESALEITSARNTTSRRPGSGVPTFNAGDCGARPCAVLCRRG